MQTDINVYSIVGSTVKAPLFFKFLVRSFPHFTKVDFSSFSASLCMNCYTFRDTVTLPYNTQSKAHCVKATPQKVN